MGRRRDRLNKRIAKQIVTRQENSIAKMAEHQRREKQMLAIIKKGKLHDSRSLPPLECKECGAKMLEQESCPYCGWSWKGE